jgi:hypothetical protein
MLSHECQPLKTLIGAVNRRLKKFSEINGIYQMQMGMLANHRVQKICII